MERITIGAVEARFADLVWEKAPLTTKELVELCAKAFDWKRTTTYTVLKRLCERGLFEMKDSVVTAKLTRNEFYARQSEQFVEESFHGSLPAFIAAFTTRKQLAAEEIEEIKKLVDLIGAK